MPADRTEWGRLRSSLSGELRTDEGALANVSADASGLVGSPGGVVAPTGVGDLIAIVRWARETRTPVVARGAGTSLDGESVPTRGGVVVDFSAWDRVLEISLSDGLARVQPGLANRALDRALRPLGLTYPPNPGSGATSTIGGNVATNASGPRSFRHGPTRAWVRSLDLVDGRGRHWTAGGRWAKSSLGPDLVGLLVGSEGTLALFAEVTVRVARRPERRTGLVAPIPDGASLGGSVGELIEALGAGGSALEYVDAATAGTLPELSRSTERVRRGLLLAEVEGTEADEEAALRRVEAWALRRGISSQIEVFPDAERLWEIRGAAGSSLERSAGRGLREDIVVPLSRLDALCHQIAALAERHGVGVRVFGHIGQGNLHPVYAVDPRSDRAETLRAELCDATLALGGAISGEHGIGATKRSMVTAQLGAPGIELLRALKATLDPLGILNPGKLLPEPAGEDGPPPSGSPSVSGAPRTPPA